MVVMDHHAIFHFDYVPKSHGRVIVTTQVLPSNKKAQ